MEEEGFVLRLRFVLVGLELWFVSDGMGFTSFSASLSAFSHSLIPLFIAS